MLTLRIRNPACIMAAMSVAMPAKPQQTAPERPEPPDKTGAKGRGRGIGKPFVKGNTTNRRGSKNKATTEASGWALPLVPEVLRRRLKHRRGCDAAKDCAMCRHYNDMVLHYAYGKPPQRHELIQATLKADTEALAKSLGLDESQTKAALAEVERHYTALKAAK